MIDIFTAVRRLVHVVVTLPLPSAAAIVILNHLLALIPFIPAAINQETAVAEPQPTLADPSTMYGKLVAAS